jgi:hypothetical protein
LLRQVGKLTQLRGFQNLLPFLGPNSRRGAYVSEVRPKISKNGLDPARSMVGLFRRPVVRSGDAIHRPAALPRLTPSAAAEWVVARVSPSSTRDAFAIGDSNRDLVAQSHVLQLEGSARTEDRGQSGRSVVREMSIGRENYKRSIIPVRSDISRFSRGTGEDQGELNLLKRDCLLLPDESAACYQLFWLDHFQSLYLDKVTLVEGGHRTSAL